MATTTIDEKMQESDDANAATAAEGDPAAVTGSNAIATEAIADRTTRVDDLRSDLDVADERSEAARLAYVEGTQQGLEPDELRTLRREWDSARAARNAVETLVMIQDATAPAATD